VRQPEHVSGEKGRLQRTGEPIVRGQHRPFPRHAAKCVVSVYPQKQQQTGEMVPTNAAASKMPGHVQHLLVRWLVVSKRRWWCPSFVSLFCVSQVSVNFFFRGCPIFVSQWACMILSPFSFPSWGYCHHFHSLLGGTKNLSEMNSCMTPIRVIYFTTSTHENDEKK